MAVVLSIGGVAVWDGSGSELHGGGGAFIKAIILKSGSVVRAPYVTTAPHFRVAGAPVRRRRGVGRKKNASLAGVLRPADPPHTLPTRTPFSVSTWQTMSGFPLFLMFHSVAKAANRVNLLCMTLIVTRYCCRTLESWIVHIRRRGAAIHYRVHVDCCAFRWPDSNVYPE